MKIFGAALLSVLMTSAVYSGPLTCNMSDYKATTGLTAAVANNKLTLAWDGDRNQELRMRWGVTAGTPTILEPAVRKKGGQSAHQGRRGSHVTVPDAGHFLQETAA